MKKTSLYLTLFISLTLSGCGNFSVFNSKTDENRNEKVTSKENIDVKGTILIDPNEQKEPDPLKPTPPMRVIVGGKTIEVPNHSRVELKIDVENEDTSNTVTTIISKFKLDTKHGQLIIWGAVLFAVGLFLMWMRVFKLGIGACLMGRGMIGIAVLVQQYPQVIFAFMAFVVVGIAYFVWQSLQIEQRKEDAKVLKKVMNAVEVVPEAKEKVKQVLREDDDSAKIREVTKRIKHED